MDSSRRVMYQTAENRGDKRRKQKQISNRDKDIEPREDGEGQGADEQLE